MVNFRWVQKASLPYLLVWVLYYAWVVSFATWWTAPSLMDNVFHTQIRGMMHAVNLISSAAFVFTMQKKWFLQASRIGSALIVVGMSLFFLARNAHVQVIAAIVSSVAIGCVNISILIPFVFRLNNTEKLYAVVGGNVLIQLVALTLELNKRGGSYDHLELLLSVSVLAVSLLAILFFKKEDMAEKTAPAMQETPSKLHRGIYLTIFFNCIIAILCKGAGKGILNITAASSNLPIFIWYFVGGLIGCGLFMTIYALSKKAFLWLGNITFACVAMGLFCNAFFTQASGFAIAFALLLGTGSTVGMINMYYVLGVIGKKYNSIRYVRWSIFLIGICGGISGVLLGNTISIGTFQIAMSASVVSVAVMILFMIVAPILWQQQYQADWAKDSQYSDINHSQSHIFKKYALSKREIEVCKLLLQGYTMRQISGILSLAYPTINTYCTSIYRKMQINSRAELAQVMQDYIAQ